MTSVKCISLFAFEMIWCLFCQENIKQGSVNLLGCSMRNVAGLQLLAYRFCVRSHSHLLVSPVYIQHMFFENGNFWILIRVTWLSFISHGIFIFESGFNTVFISDSFCVLICILWYWNVEMPNDLYCSSVYRKCFNNNKMFLFWNVVIESHH